MNFGDVPVADAQGAILAHSVRAGSAHLRKGIILAAEDCQTLASAGVETVTVARLETDDIHEDEAALRIARAAAGTGMRLGQATTGRCNLHAVSAGVLRVDAAAINAANAINEAITLATPLDFTRLGAGQLAATAKIIPYGAPHGAVDAACKALVSLHGALRIAPFQPFSAVLLMTQTPGQKDSLNDKAALAIEMRLAALSGTLVHTRTVPHREDAVVSALRSREWSDADLTLILAGSATSDRADVAPAAIVEAGGRIDRFGMPVDPGNLLVLAELYGAPAIVLPGCARSPALNGADWVLERIAARLPVAGADIAAMGVGGLLKEIPTRPQPREPR